MEFRAEEKVQAVNLRADWHSAEQKPHLRLQAELEDAARVLDEIEDEERYDLAFVREKKLKDKIEKGRVLSEDEEKTLAISRESVVGR